MTDPWALAHDSTDVGTIARRGTVPTPDTHALRLLSTDPLAVLANRYLDRRRHFESDGRQHVDSEVSAFTDAQEELLEQIAETPAVTLDDLIAKLEVIAEEIWDDAGLNDRNPNVLEPAARLSLTLRDDVRRVIELVRRNRAECHYETTARAAAE